MPSIGDLIKEKRTEKNISQRKLAELCGMSYSHICRLEKGENIPTLDTITKISNALGVPPDIFTFDENDELSEFMKQSIQQLMDSEVDLFLNLISHINDNYCIDKFDLSVLTN
ncbi:helix-turn-helix transcriptional regulator, partial [Clostridium subterminale]